MTTQLEHARVSWQRRNDSLAWVLPCVALACLGCEGGTGGELSQEELVSNAEQALICGQSDFVQSQCLVTLWPSGIIPYKFDNSPIVSNGTTTCPGGTWTTTQQANAQALMDRWSSTTKNTITFVKSTSSTAVRIHLSSGGGFFGLGYNPSGGDGCMDPSGQGWNALHELGHLIGLQHGMIRNDRDRYIAVNTDWNCAEQERYSQVAVRCGQDRFQLGSSGTVYGDRSDYGPFDATVHMMYGGGCDVGTCDANFQGCTQGVCSLITRGGGNTPPNPDLGNISDIQASAAVELYAETLNWQRFRPAPSTTTGSTSPFNFDVAPGAMMDGSPAVVRWQGETWVMARAGTNLWWKVYAPKALPWARHQEIDSVMSDPALSVRDLGTVLDVAAVRSNQVVFQEYTDAGGWVSASLGAPSASTPSAPAVASCSTGTVSVFVISDSKLYEKRFNGSSWAPTWTARSSAILTGKPSAVSWSAQRIDVVAAKASTGSVEHFWTDNCSSSFSEDNLGGVVKSGTSPAIASHTQATLSVFVTATNGVLYEKKFSTNWGSWVSIGGYLGSSSPAAWGGVANNTHGFWLAAKLQERMPVGTSRRGLWMRHWASCPTVDSNGSNSFCSDLCPCNEGQGDCDSETMGTDCVGDLVCATNLGPRYGFSSATDVCADPGCLNQGLATACNANCPCGVGGACVNHEDCLPRLMCNGGHCG